MKNVYFSIHILFAVTLAVLPQGCARDDIFNTDHPHQSEVTIVADWSDRNTQIERPQTYIVQTAGVRETATADLHTLNEYLDPGNHTFLVYTQVEGIRIENGTAKVDAVSDSHIHDQPGWLLSGTATAFLEADRNYRVPVLTMQQVRQLTITINPEGEAAGMITGIEATLTGVAGSWELIGNTASGQPVSITPVFSKSADGSWSASVRLLGTTGSSQRLTGAVKLEGSEDDVPLDSDLSGLLSSFNGDKKTPLAVKGSVTVEPVPDPQVEAGFQATIEDWQKVTEGSDTAI